MKQTTKQRQAKMDVDKLANEALERVYANIDANAAAAQKELNAMYHEAKKVCRVRDKDLKELENK